MSLRSTIRRNFWSDLQIRRIRKSLEIEGQIRRIRDLHKMYGQNRKYARKYGYDTLSARHVGYVTRLNFSAKSAIRSEKSAQSTICKIYCPIIWKEYSTTNTIDHIGFSIFFIKFELGDGYKFQFYIKNGFSVLPPGHKYGLSTLAGINS